MNDPTAPPATPAGPPVTPVVEPYSHSGLSPSHAAQWIEWEKENLAKGAITPEEAARRFDALGATPEQRALDTRSDEVKLLDQQFPPAQAEDYLIRYGEPGQPFPAMTPELKQADTAIRTWLAGAEFPRELGNSLITQIERTGRATRGMTPEQRKSYGEAEYTKLERVFGETLGEKLQLAAVMIDAADKQQPGLKQLLESNAFGDDALVVVQLIGQAERWHARRKGH